MSAPTAPLHARDVTGKGRYYGPCQESCPLGSDTGELYISVTNAQGVVAKPALVPAAAKVTAAAAWRHLPVMVATSRQDEAGIPVDGGKPCDRRKAAERCGGCRFCVTAAIKGSHREEWDYKRDLGTRVHWYAHSKILGKPEPFDEEVEPFMGSLLRFFDDFAIDITNDSHVLAAETTVFDRKNRYAGTGDLWANVPGFGRAGGRGLVLIDYKTSLIKPAAVVYDDQELQLAALRYAPSAVLVDDTEVEVPKFAATALLNLRPNGEYAFIPVPAGRDAHKAFLHAVGLKGYLHGVDSREWTPMAPPKAVA